VVVRQYDIFKSSNDLANQYLFVLQHSINTALPTVLVAPIAKIPVSKIVTKLDIPMVLDGQSLHLRTHYMAAIPRSQLRTFVENRNDMHDDVIAAVDILFTGF
jgi:toxin CcdB